MDSYIVNLRQNWAIKDVGMIQNMAYKLGSSILNVNRFRFRLFSLKITP